MARPVAISKGSRLVVMAAVCVVIAALYFAQDVLIPLALAVLFGFLLAPFVTRLQRLGLSRIPAVIVVVSLATGIIVALAWATTLQVINLADRFPEYRGEITEKVHNLRQRFGGGGGIVDRAKEVADIVEKASTQPAASQPASQPATATSNGVAAAPADPVEQVAHDPLGSAAREAARVPATAPTQAAPGAAKDNPLWVALTEPRGPIGQLGSVLGRIASPLGTAGLVLVFVIFMLIQREDLRDRVIRLVGKGQLYVTTDALDDAATRISRYMLAQVIVNGTYGIAVAIGLWAIG